MPGTLFVVATPIGNLEDLSFRALRTLKEVDLIAAEDTRRTSKLLAHYEIRRPLTSLREHNEAREAPRLVARIAAGESVALVTDAGTPGIADPGARFVRAAREAGLSVVPVPGPSAVATALSASGFSADQFVFLGFPPPAGARRQTWLQALPKYAMAIVFFEAPHRVAKTLKECSELLGERQIIAFREISKINEESVIYQNNSQIRQQGEFVITIESTEARSGVLAASPDAALVADIFGYITEHPHGGADAALKHTAVAFGLSERSLLKLIKKYRYSTKQPIVPVS